MLKFFPNYIRFLAPMVLIVAQLVVAQLVAAQSAQALTITGTVIGPDETPLADARVWAVQNRLPVAATADADGRFAFEGIAVGAVDFVAHAEGYALGGLSVRAVGDADIELRLAEPEVLPIRVTTTGFEPIAGARLLSATINSAFRVAVDDLLELGFPSLRSDDDGNLDIPWLPAGGFAQLEVGHLRYARAYVPYLSTAQDRQTVVLRHGLAVGGRVVSPDGEPVDGARVSIFSQTGSGPLEVAQPVTAPDGFYTARVREGDYFVVARHPEHAGPPPMPLSVGGYDDIRVELIQMLPRAAVQGRVHFDDDTPAAAVRVAFLAHETVYSDAITDIDGRFTLDASPEPGVVQVIPPPGYYLPEGPMAEVAPKPGSPVETPPFELAPLPSIRGTVIGLDGEPVPHAILSTYDLPKPLHAVADAAGEFAIALDFAPELNRLAFRVEHPTLFERTLYEADIAERDPREVRLERYAPDMAVLREGWEPPNNLEGLVGRVAPPLAVVDWYNTAPIARADLRGKVVVLTFWGGFATTGATPDRIAEMRALHAAMPPENVVFIALHDSASLPEDVAYYVGEYNIGFPVAQDIEDGDTFSAYGITVIPQTILIGRDGTVRHYDVEGRLPELIKVLGR